jgi:amidase
MARTVTDAAILLGALVGSEPRDPATTNNRGRTFSDYTAFLDPDGLRGARIGIARNFFGFHDQVDQIMEAHISLMERLGAEIVDPANIETAQKVREPEFQVLLYEFKADLNAYLARLNPNVPVRSLAELIEFNERNRETVMPYFGQERLCMAQEKGPLTSPEYLTALDTARRLSRTEGIDAVLRKYQLDAIVAPAAGPAWLTDWITGDHPTGTSCTIAAVAGYPNITIPSGYIAGLPVGMSFLGGPYQEPTLLKLAFAFEQATQVRRPPQFRETIKF